MALRGHPFVSIDLVTDGQNHYYKGHQSFLNAVDLIREKQYGAAFTAVIEANLHLQIHSTQIVDVGLHKYILMKHQEFTKFSEKILERILNGASAGPIEMQSDTERLR